MLAEIPLLLAVLFVGTDFVAVKYALEGFPPLALAALRFTVAGLLLCGLALLLEPASRPKKSDFVPMLGLGLVGFSLNQGSYIGGLSLTSGSNAALVVATAPVWGLLLGVALRLERARLRGVLGVVLALIGVGFVMREGLGSPGASLPGDLLVLVSALSLGAYTVLSLPLLRRYPPLSVAAYPMLLGGVALIPLASADLMSMDWGAVGVRAWAGIAYSTVLASAFAFAAWQRGVSRTGRTGPSPTCTCSPSSASLRAFCSWERPWEPPRFSVDAPSSPGSTWRGAARRPPIPPRPPGA